MKRVLLLGVSLAAALALLWLGTRRAPPPRAAATPSEIAVAPAVTTSASARTESEPPVAPLEREALAVPTRVEQGIDPLTPSAESLPGPKATVRGYVARRLTQERVRGEARLLMVPPGEDGTGQGRNFSKSLDDHMRQAKLDEQGRFQFELPIGTRLFELTVMPLMPTGDSPCGGFEAANQFVIRTLQLNETLGEAGLDLVVEVEDSLEITGLVREADTLAPLEGVRIRIPEASDYVPAATSGPDGRFKLSGLPPAFTTRRWDLRAERMDHLKLLVHVEPAQLVPGAQPLVVELSRGLVIAGSVVDAQGVPVRGASLRIRAVGFDPGIEFSAGVITTRTDESGAFRYAPVPPCNSLGVELPAQSCDGRDLLLLQRDFGPLRADRTDLQLQVQTSGILEVRAQLADGTPLGSREFQVICTNVAGVQSAGATEAGMRLRVPVGVDLELEAYASARDEQQPGQFIRGRERVRVEPRESAPQVVVFVLGERNSFRAPPPREGVHELKLSDENYLLATVDVQLLDAATGSPIGAGMRVSVSGFGAGIMTSSLPEGWLRIRGRPGTQEFAVAINDGTHEVMQIVIPTSGYATAEWRLKVGP